MPYVLRFSDRSKTQEVIVPDMPPGINTVDTSLNLIGRNYPNYGEKISENFLRLLENFASALPPENPIEGQLWYDTSDPNNKVLRVMDGTASSTRWPSATGIYQQGTDPKNSASSSLKNGDIWVDTSVNQLKIYNGNQWTIVGPSVGSQTLKTGIEPTVIEDTTGTSRKVLISYVNGNVVSITANETFTPKTVIDGFSAIRPGVTISTKNSARLNSTANAALQIEIDGFRYNGERFLRKDDNSVSGQVITGKVVFQTPSAQVASQGRDGVVINITGYSSSEYIQLYKYGNDAILLNNKASGKIIFKTKTPSSAGMTDTLTIDNGAVGINTSTSYSSPTLDVYGNARILSTLTILSTATNSLTLNGGLYVAKNLNVNTNLLVTGVTTSTGILHLGSVSGNGTIINPKNHNTYDIGSSSNSFRYLYVSAIGSTGTGTVVYGRVIGAARSLEYSSEFKLEGQVTATSFVFSGNGATATFTTSLSPTAISAQTESTTSTSTMMLLTLNTVTSSLSKISRDNFISGIIPAGAVMAYGAASAPYGWLLCNGNSYLAADYVALFSTIGYTYGGSGAYFNVPNMTSISAAGGIPVYYIIKK